MSNEDYATEPTETCGECGCPLLEGCRGGVLSLPDRSARPCPNRAAAIAGRRLEAAAVPDLYRDCTVDGLRVEGLRGARQLVANRDACRSYVERFKLWGEGRTVRGLLLVGPPGTGKTHLLAAVLQALIRRSGARGVFADFTTVCHQIQDSFDDPHMSEAKVLRPLLDAQVLALDELGARRPTPFVLDTLYLIINTRYAQRLPTMFSTNHPLEAPRPAAPSRGGGTDRVIGSAALGRFDRIDQDGGEEEDFLPLHLRVGARIVSRLYEATEPPLLFDQVGDYRRLRA